MIAIYIYPGSPNEINLPSHMREQLLVFTCEGVSPPSPEELSPAMDHAYESLTDDALLPFINSFNLKYNHYTAGHVPNSIQSHSKLDQVFSRTAKSPEGNDLYDESIKTLRMQALTPASRSHVDDSITKQIEHTQLPQGFPVKLRFWNRFKIRKFKRWFTFLKLQFS